MGNYSYNCIYTVYTVYTTVNGPFIFALVFTDIFQPGYMI